MKYKITAKDELKNTITVQFLTNDGVVFKTLIMQASLLPIDNAEALDAELAKQALAMISEVETENKVWDVTLDVVKEA